LFDAAWEAFRDLFKDKLANFKCDLSKVKLMMDQGTLIEGRTNLDAEEVSICCELVHTMGSFDIFIIGHRQDSIHPSKEAPDQ